MDYPNMNPETEYWKGRAVKAEADLERLKQEIKEALRVSGLALLATNIAGIYASVNTEPRRDT